MTLRQSATNNLLEASFLAHSATGAKTSITTLGAAARGWICDINNTPCDPYGGGAAETNGADPGNNYVASSARPDPANGQPADFGVFGDWCSFAVPEFDSPLVSATLNLQDNNRDGAAKFTYTIYSLTTQPLRFTDINNDLVVLETATTTPGSLGQTVIVSNAAGLSAINAARGLTMYIGGIDSGGTLGGSNGGYSFTWNDDSGSSVPVPSTPVINPTARANANVTRAVPPVGFTPGGPLPTPATFDFLGSRVAYIIVKASDGYMSCILRPNALLGGVIADGSNLYGIPTGTRYAPGFGVSAITAGAPTINMKSPTLTLDDSGSTGGT